MRVLGIVAEYNPFHSGHKYHLEQSGQDTCADFFVAVMSGNFVQRGEPAYFDKWERARAAVENGVNLVLELPFAYACNTAGSFAKGAIGILNGLGCVTDISFGSESGDLDELLPLAKALSEESEDFKRVLKEKLDEGEPYPKARAIALGATGLNSWLLFEPNNILGVEYLLQLERLGANNIIPHTVKRSGPGHTESGAEIRSNLGTSAVEIFFPFVREAILKASDEELSQILSVGEGLENKLKEAARKANSLDELANMLKSKRYTRTRVNRVLMHTFLGLTKADFAKIEAENQLYTRVLAFDEKGRKLLRHIADEKTASIPIHTALTAEIQQDSKSFELMKYDVLATDLWNLAHGEDLYKKSDFLAHP